MRFFVFSVLLFVSLGVAIPVFANTDDELSRASRAEDAREKKRWEDGWLGLVAGAYKFELNNVMRDYFNLQVVEVQLVGFSKLDEGHAGPGKRMRVWISDGSRCVRDSVKCGKRYNWKLYCARPDGSRLYSSGGCGY